MGPNLFTVSSSQQDQLIPCKSYESKINSENANNVGDMPSYFKLFIAHFDACQEKLFSKLNEIETRMGNRIAALEKDVSQIRDKLSHFSHQTTLVDSAEMILTGIPRGVNLSKTEIVNRVFHAMDEPELQNAVINVREWKGPNFRNKCSSISTPSSNSQQTENEDSSQAIVIQLSSPTVRDRMISSSPKLRKKSIRDMFGYENDSKIICSPLWPKEIHNLLKKARSLSAHLKYQNPVVKNLIVCMRRSRGEPLVPIFSELDLDNFVNQISSNV